MLTFGSGEHSLWRSLDDGERWETIFSSTLADVDTIIKIKFPQNSDSSQVLFIAGVSNGNSAVWKSTDGGQSFGSPFATHDPTTGA
ncbi:MAG: hypothetical protein FJ025_02345, partial [Chloroflexi bacterium]|nr:hypothetical protein [Chloroflexota bacterium]